jgi:intracellular sulfur oxidation DsrE/DsrF family protein
MIKRVLQQLILPLTVLTFGLASPLVSAAELAPYGTAKEDMHEYPTINAVFDVNYEDPAKLGILYNFVKNTAKPLKGNMVVVTHGPELRVFAKENYMKYQGIVDKMAELSESGVEFRMCSNAMRAAGFKSSDMHGFITVVPAGFPEIALLQSEGYKYINPIPLSVKDVRYLEHDK